MRIPEEVIKEVKEKINQEIIEMSEEQKMFFDAKDRYYELINEYEKDQADNVIDNHIDEIIYNDIDDNYAGEYWYDDNNKRHSWPCDEVYNIDNLKITLDYEKCCEYIDYKNYLIVVYKKGCSIKRTDKDNKFCDIPFGNDYVWGELPITIEQIDIQALKNRLDKLIKLMAFS